MGNFLMRHLIVFYFFSNDKKGFSSVKNPSPYKFFTFFFGLMVFRG